MNKSRSQASRNLLLLLLLTTTHTQSMLIKNISRIPSSMHYSTALTFKFFYKPMQSHWTSWYECVSFPTSEDAAQALTNREFKKPALMFFNDRIKNDQDPAAIINIAKKLLNPCASSQDTRRGQKSALSLFNLLLQKQHPQTDEIISEIATKALMEGDCHMRKTASKLFEILFHYDAGFDAATQTAEHLATHRDWRARRSALQLLYMIIENNREFKIAEKIASQQININQKIVVKMDALAILLALVKKNHAVDTSKKAFAKVWHQANHEELVPLIHLSKDFKKAYEQTKY